ncbi:MAG: hypothetical protein IKY74_05620 [Alistipes sp.]|nr:hypothetical protein [Alistipes sp.]
MKKFFLFAVMFAAATMMVSCGAKQQKCEECADCPEAAECTECCGECEAVVEEAVVEEACECGECCAEEVEAPAEAEAAPVEEVVAE